MEAADLAAAPNSEITPVAERENASYWVKMGS
jgi:hypothetical protein